MEIKPNSLLDNPIQANAGYSPAGQNPIQGDPFSNYLQEDDQKSDQNVLSSVKNYAQAFLNDARSVERDIKEVSMGQQGVDTAVPKVAVFAANVELVKGTTEAIIGGAKGLINMQI